MSDAFLFIDPTARDTTRVLFTADGRRLFCESRPTFRQSDDLPILICDWLGSHGVELKALTGLVVVTGPGATTSVRIGVAMAEALSDNLGIPLFGIPLFEAALDRAVASVQFVVTGGRRGHWVLKAFAVKSDGMATALTDVIALPEEQCIRLLNKLSAPTMVRWVNVSDPPMDQMAHHHHVVVGFLPKVLADVADKCPLDLLFQNNVSVQYAYEAVG